MTPPHSDLVREVPVRSARATASYRGNVTLSGGSAGFRLVPDPSASRLDERFFGRFRRVGLRGVLDDLDRAAVVCPVPAEAAGTGVRWDDRDQQTRRWWPQGITTSADAYGPDPSGGTFDGEPVVLTSWYAHGAAGRRLGARLSVLAGIDGAAPTYRHVLLVDPRRRAGAHRLHPVNVHAGGLVWYGRHLFVAGSSGGIRVFRLDDVIRVRSRWRTKGYRYVLPQLTRYLPHSDVGTRPMTYSFLSLDRRGDVDHLVAGEYGRKGAASHRLVRYALDRDTELLTVGDHGRVDPLEHFERQVVRMQGAAMVGSRWVLTSSNGEGKPGDLWVGTPGEFRRHRGVLPTGPEDITYWPQRRQLWTLTEWPGRRWIYPVDVDEWVPERH